MEKQKVKQDIFLLLGILLAALAIGMLWGLVNRGKPEMAVVLQDGREIGRYPLSEERTVMVPYHEQDYNLILISGGAVSVSDADCPDRLCVNQHAISGKGESIICLPHKLVITIDSDKESELDALTY